MNDISEKRDGFGIGELGRGQIVDEGLAIHLGQGYDPKCHECGQPLDDEARRHHLMGSGVMCRECLERYFQSMFGHSVTEEIAQQEADRQANIHYCHYCGMRLKGGQSCPECR